MYPLMAKNKRSLQMSFARREAGRLPARRRETPRGGGRPNAVAGAAPRRAAETRNVDSLDRRSAGACWRHQLAIVATPTNRGGNLIRTPAKFTGPSPIACPATAFTSYT